MSKLSKNVVIFDLDGTLTKSKSPIDSEMADTVCALLKIAKVAVISGGGYPQFLSQFVGRLPSAVDKLSNLYLLPTSGTRLYSWKGFWQEQYSENLKEEEKEKIISNLKAVLRALNYDKPEKVFGDLIEDRGSQITFSALGQKAPVELKYAWDPDRKKREKLAEILSKRLGEFDVRIGGSTSVDITRKGINKAYGIRKLEQFLNIPIENMIFVGDALFYGGNDYPVKATGIDCLEVKGPEETITLIKEWLEN